jgi:hypothetical protein
MLFTLALGAALSVAIGWNRRTPASARSWDVPGLGGMFIDISGTLAGFNIASATFIASTSTARDSPSFAAAVGMLLISFLMLMSAAMMYSTTPKDPGSQSRGDSGSVVQSLTSVLANAGYFLGVALGWMALRPLLVLIGLQSLADAFTWLLLVTALAGSARFAGLTYRLTEANTRACLLLPILGFGLPLIYWFVSARAVPQLWPESGAPLSVGFLAFAVTSITLALQMGILLARGNADWERRLITYGHRLALAVGQATVVAIDLVWLAVATT